MSNRTTLRALWQGAHIYLRAKGSARPELARHYNELAYLYSAAAAITELPHAVFCKHVEHQVEAARSWCTHQELPIWGEHAKACVCRAVARESEGIIGAHETYGGTTFVVDDDRIVFQEVPS